MLLTLIKFISNFIPLGVFLFNRKIEGFKGFIFSLVLFAVLNTILTGIFNRFENEAYYYFNNLSYTPIEFLLVALMIRTILKNAQFKRLVLLSIPIFFFFWIVILSTISSKNFDSAAVALEELLLITFCIIYFYENIKNPNTIFIYSTQEFWAITGILIYASSTFFVYLFRESNWQNLNFREQYDYIHHCASIFKNICFAIAIGLKPYKTTNILNKIDRQVT